VCVCVCAPLSDLHTSAGHKQRGPAAKLLFAGSRHHYKIKSLH
jgi:hypothetical protein